MQKTKPFLKWAGGKFQIIDVLLKYFPTATRLIEPFTGSGAVFLNTNFSNYILAEQNRDLINLFLQLQKEGPQFINYCANFFVAANNCADKFYLFRQQFNQCKHLKRRAGIFLYLNRHGFNGLCRYNQQGGYNVPFGRYVKPYFPRREMTLFHQKSHQAIFIPADFRQTFELAQPGDIIYCDPPYVPLSSTAYFNHYTPIKFTLKDHIDLSDLAFKSAKKGITVIISNHDTPFTRHYYRHGQLISLTVRRSISCHANKRYPAPELLAIFNDEVYPHL